jgi:DNA topoisomerase-1
LTEARVVRLLEENGIGRPSTYASLIDKIQERKYVKLKEIAGKKIECAEFELDGDSITETRVTKEFGNEKNKLVIQKEGVIVIDFLYQFFSGLFDYKYTREMEDKLDMILNCSKSWIDVCNECLNDIEMACKNTNHSNKFEIKIDDEHSYIIGKYGPVIKKIDGTFLPIKKEVELDFDLDKLKKGEYIISDLVDKKEEKEKEEKEEKEKEKEETIYEGHPLFIKKGKFGLYAVWGDKKLSLSKLGNRPLENIKMEEVIALIETTTPTEAKRILTSSISIRNSNKGDYIFYKTTKMKKPSFFKLNGFKEDYMTCSKEILLNWIKTEYQIK